MIKPTPTEAAFPSALEQAVFHESRTQHSMGGHLSYLSWSVIGGRALLSLAADLTFSPHRPTELADVPFFSMQISTTAVRFVADLFHFVGSPDLPGHGPGGQYISFG